MRIYPINQSPVMFRGSNNNQNHVMKRYCEPRTGVYYYYDTVEFENQKSQSSFSNFFKNLKNKFSKMSEAFTRNSVNNTDNDEILWL